MNLEAVQAVAEAVAAKTAAAFSAGHDVIVLGGDCTIELGTVTGAIRSCGGSVGLIYVDVDTDLNPPDASDGALDWTGVAHLLSIPGAADELADIGDVRPMLQPSNILYLAAGNIEANEREMISALGIACIGLDEVQADPRSAAERALMWANRFDVVLVHLDADVLDFAAFPIAENTRRDMGLTLEQLKVILNVLLGAPNLRGLTIAEVNPDHAPDEREAFTELISMLASALRRD
jgi:arginase